MALDQADRIYIKATIAEVVRPIVREEVHEVVHEVVHGEIAGLAVMVKQGFDDVDRRFEEVDRQFKEVKDDIRDIKLRQVDTAERAEVFDLKHRVEKLEDRVYHD